MLLKLHKKNVLVTAGILLLAMLLIFAKPTVFRPKVRNELLPQTVHLKKTVVPSGREVYQVTQAAEIWPKIIEATIDPPDVHVGDIQKLSVTLEDEQSISLVEARIETDNSTTTVPLKETKRDGTKITYANKWVVKDTHDTTYHTTFFAKDATGRESSITLAWSDACGIFKYGDWTMSSNCTISSPDGVDGGNVTINSGTLTLNADFAFNPGSSLTINGGSIVIAAGRSLRQTYIWWTDTDNDYYAGSQANILQDTAPAGAKRRSDIGAYGSPLIDCDDSSNVVQRTYNYWYDDQDGDGYTFREALGVCVSEQVGTAVGCPDDNYAKQADGSCIAIGPRNGPDCYDTNANAHPGQTTYFTTNRGDGSYDYDCSGVAEEQTPVASCGGTYPACGTQAGFFGDPGCGNTGSMANCQALCSASCSCGTVVFGTGQEACH